ncbi:Ig-like domain (group 2) [Lachnospiraceae bacterium KHCPX20]|nr:Ig-like domain (group 2) [Lachnospiraceae bacterium KHCPX20]
MKNKKRNLSLLLAAGLTLFPAIALLSTSTVTARADLKEDIVKEVTDPSTIAVSSVTLDKHELTLTCGSAETLTASILPQNATNKLITWSSTNPLIAKVDFIGNKVSVLAGSLPGKATISARSPEGACDTCTVYVKELPQEAVTSVTLDDTTKVLSVGETASLIATVDPSTAKDKSVYWTSSNNDIVTVDSTGKITGISEGNAHVRVYSVADNSRYATCSISVTAPKEPEKDTNQPDNSREIQKQKQIHAIQNTKGKILSVKSRESRLIVTASAKRVDGVAVKYQFRYRQAGSKKWKVTSSPSEHVNLKKLKSGKKYTLQVRTFAAIDQKKYYGAWSPSVTKKTK